MEWIPNEQEASVQTSHVVLPCI